MKGTHQAEGSGLVYFVSSHKPADAYTLVQFMGDTRAIYGELKFNRRDIPAIIAALQEALDG